MRFVQTNLNAISSGSEIEQPDNVLEPIVHFKGTPPLIIVKEVKISLFFTKSINLKEDQSWNKA